MSAMIGHDSDVTSAENYGRFARLEAAGRAPAYERLAEAVAGDEEILDFLARLPAAKRQPNLLFAAARQPGWRSRHTQGQQGPRLPYLISAAALSAR